MIGAVILAAGAGARLGGIAKALLPAAGGGAPLGGIAKASLPAAGAGAPLGGIAKALLPAAGAGTFLDRIVATARAAGAEAITVVVAPPFGDAAAARARALAADVVWNREPERGMASSIALGFAAIARTACDRAWLWPVDHPDVALDTLRALAAALGDRDAARPTWRGRGGHPPLVARRLFGPLAACAELPRGARDVLAAADVCDVPVDDVGCMRDVDTPEDLARREAGR